MAGGERTVKIKFTGDSRGVALAAKEAERSVSKVRAGIESAGRMAMPAAAASAALLGAAIAPALAAALAGGVVLALGGGVLLAGIMGAAKDPGVAKAFKGLGDRATKSLADFSKPFREPLKRAADTFGDAIERMAPTINALGRTLAPVIDKLAPALAAVAEKALPGIAQAAAQSVPLFEKLAAFLPTVGTWIGNIAIKLAEFTNWAIQNADAIGMWISILAPIIGIFIGIVGAIRAWIAVQTLLNVVMSLNPIGLVVIAVAALIAVIVVIATRTKFFQTIWGAAWNGIKSAASNVGSWFKDTLWGSWIKGSWEAIVNKGNSVLSWFQNMPGRIRGFFGSLGNYITAPFRSAFNSIAHLWNSTVGQLNFSVPGWVPGIGGNNFSLPHIPERRWGGPVASKMPYLVGEHGPELFVPEKNGRIIPNEKVGGGSDTQTVILEINLGEGISRVFEAKIKKHVAIQNRTAKAMGPRRLGK